MILVHLFYNYYSVIIPSARERIDTGREEH